MASSWKKEGKDKTFGVYKNIFPYYFLYHIDSTMVPGFSRKPSNFVANHNTFYRKAYSNF